jgi:dipeptidyl aminopeptidase/acylaminoacyl peptidase
LSIEAPVDWITPAGVSGQLRTTASDWSSIHFSPAGDSVAMQIFDGAQWDVWLYEWTRDTLSRLTFDLADDEAPAWTPDGRRVTFASKRGDKKNENLYWQRSDGTGEVTRLTDRPLNQMPASWHPKGKLLAFVEQGAQTAWDIMLLTMEGDEGSGLKPSKPSVFLNSPAIELEPVFSPDGKWLAYISNESGGYEIYVRPFPGPGGKWQISSGGGVYPTWSKSRPELFYSATSDLQIMTASYSTQGETFRAEKPKPWSEQRIVGRRVNRHYDLHPDGRRIAAARVDETQFQARHVTLIFNFLDELRRLAPTGGRAN